MRLWVQFKITKAHYGRTLYKSRYTVQPSLQTPFGVPLSMKKFHYRILLKVSSLFFAGGCFYQNESYPLGPFFVGCGELFQENPTSFLGHTDPRVGDARLYNLPGIDVLLQFQPCGSNSATTYTEGICIHTLSFIIQARVQDNLRQRLKSPY